MKCCPFGFWEKWFAMIENFNLLKRFSYKEQVSRSITWGHYFIFINILLSCLLGYSYVYAAPPANDFLSFFYLLVSWLGHMSFLTVVAYLVLLFPLAFIGNFRYYRVIAVAIAVVLHTILLFDIKIYLMVKVHLSMTALNLIVRELDFNTGLNYNFLFIAIPVVIALECVFAKITTHSLYRAHHPWFVRSVLILVGSCFISSHLLHIWADASQYERITLLRSTFPAHYPMTAKSFLNNHGWFNSDELNYAQVSPAEYLNYPLSKIEIGTKNPCNVIVISINGLSQRNLSAENTPELLRLKQKAQSFEQNYLLYQDNIDNTFAASFGLPLQYRNMMLAAQILPVAQDELLRQDFVRRMVVSDSRLLQAKYQHEKEMSRSNLNHTGLTAPAISSLEVPTAEDKDTASAVTTGNEPEGGADADAVSVKATAVSRNQAWLSHPDFQLSPAMVETNLNYGNALVANAALRLNQLSTEATAHDAFAQALTQIRQYQHQEQRPYALNIVLNDLLDYHGQSKLRRFTASAAAAAAAAAPAAAGEAADPDTVPVADPATVGGSNDDESFIARTDPQVLALLQYERTLQRTDSALGSFMRQLEREGLKQNTLVIITSFEGNRMFTRPVPHYDREVQHVPLLVLWPEAQQLTASVTELSSPQDIYATVAYHVAAIVSPPGNYTLGYDLRALRQRRYLTVDGSDAIMLVGYQDNTIYLQDGVSYIERDGVQSQVRPDLESLIEATRDLNRFLR